MNKIFLNNIGDLSEASRASYTQFLLKGIKEELFSLPIILYAYNKHLKKKLHHNKKIKLPYCINYHLIQNINNSVTKTLFYKDEIKFKFNGVASNKAFLKNKSYTILLYIKGRKLLTKKLNHNYKINSKTQNISFIETYFLLGEIPLITKEGTFIINGCERIMVNQIIKCPGIFFKKIINPREYKSNYIATIVSRESKYTKIFYKQISKYDNREQIYIKLNYFSSFLDYSYIGKSNYDSNKLYVFDIINYFLENNYKTFPDFKYPKKLYNQRLTQEYNNNNQQLSLEEKLKISKTMQNIIEKIYVIKNGNFCIGEIGRYNVNKKLSLELPKAMTDLTYLDFIRITEMLIELKYFGRTSDDMDHMREKQIRSLGKFLQVSLKGALEQIVPESFSFKKRINLSKNSTFYIKNMNIFNFSIKHKYICNRVFTFILNKLQINLKEKLINIDFKNNNFLGFSQHIKAKNNFNINFFKNKKLIKVFKRFFITNSLAQYMDQTNPLAELTQKRRLSILGASGLKRDCVPKGIRDIHPSRHGKICIIETPEGKNAGLITSIAMYARISLYGWIETPYFLIKNCIVLKEKKPKYLSSFEDSFASISFADVNLNLLNSINQKYLSVKENYSFNTKKANVVKFLTTSQMQILSLGSSLVPFVEHNDASRALMGSNMQRQAVPLILSSIPLVGTNLEIAASSDSGMTLKNSSEGIVIHSAANKIIIKDNNGFIILYNLKKYKRSNQHTSYNQKPCVWAGEIVFSNQIIGDGPSTYNGELSLGRNLTVAYMPWEGYNFEDSILINEKLIYENILTSIHIDEQKLILQKYNLDFDIISNKSPYHTEYLKRHLNNKGIVRVGSYVYGKDILIGKLSKIFNYEPTPEEILLESVFGSSSSANFKDTSLQLPQNKEGRVIDIKIFNITTKKIETKTIAKKFRIFLGIIRKIAIGDKLSGRHGNKGIVSKIMKLEDMPYLPDGISVDIILNPLGVPSRMNIGQIFECLLGFASNNLKTRIKVVPFDEIYCAESSRMLVYQKLKEAGLKSKKKWIFSSLMPGKTYIRDGRTGIFFDNPITIGKSYILKLIHIVEEKIHTRSVGTYNKLTAQPLRGKTLGGGQRFGEMETWALEAHGCSYVLKELLNLKSDDINGRIDAYSGIALNSKKSTGSISEIFLILIKELNSIGLYFSAFNIKNGFYTTTDIKIKEKNFIKSIENRLNLQDTFKKKLIFCQ